jgi:hypothetical protein
VTKDSALVFSLADGRGAQSKPHEPIDLTIELIDDAGATARLPLSSVSFLQPQIEVQLTKASFIGGFAPSEIIFQSFEFPLADFVVSNPQFDLSQPQTIRFVFDRTPAGVVVLDNIGFGTRQYLERRG